MLLSNRLCRIGVVCALGIGALGLSGCGYQPLYARSSTQSGIVPQLAAIDVGNIPDRSGQQMKLALTHKLHRRAGNAAKAYDLKVSLAESIQQLAIEKDAFATRANLQLTANYQLIRQQDGLQLQAGSLKTIASYNILSSDFATLSAEQSARDNAIENLSNDLYTRLAAYFQGPGRNPPPLQSSTAVR